MPGELVKDEHFTLFESVAALEVNTIYPPKSHAKDVSADGNLKIMDSKMDSGALAQGESLDEEYDVSRDLLPEEILGIIDQLLCLEVRPECLSQLFI